MHGLDDVRHADARWVLGQEEPSAGPAAAVQETPRAQPPEYLGKKLRRQPAPVRHLRSLEVARCVRAPATREAGHALQGVAGGEGEADEAQFRMTGSIIRHYGTHTRNGITSAKCSNGERLERSPVFDFITVNIKIVRDLFAFTY